MKILHTISLLLLSLMTAVSLHAEVADILIFSYDRPMQLYAFLESLETNVQGVGETAILYRASNKEVDVGYQIVQERFQQARYYKQGANTQEDFFAPMLTLLNSNTSHYLLFVIDDVIVKEHLDLTECIDLLNAHSASEFYLRLGEEVSPLPPFEYLNENILCWQIKAGSALNYSNNPNALDMTIYKKQDILNHFPKIAPSSSTASSKVNQRHICLCYKTPKVVRLPLKGAQSDWFNTQSTASKQLLTLFLSGLKIDLRPFFGDETCSEIEFTQRCY